MNSIQAGVVTIGVDPHPSSHTAAALDEHGKLLGSITVSHGNKGFKKLKAWAAAFERRRWAIEGLGNHYIYPFATSLLKEGEQLYAISPNLTCQYRNRGGEMKEDEVDAANAARALLANPTLSPYRPSVCQKQAQRLTRLYRKLRGQLKANEMALVEVEDNALKAALQSAIEGLKALAALEKQLKELCGVCCRVTQRKGYRSLSRFFVAR